MDLKAIIKGVLGEKGVDQLSLFKARVGVTRNRLLRACSASQKVNHVTPPIQTYGVRNAHTFFGYYDICPFSEDNTRLLAMATASVDHDVSIRQDLRIGYFDLHDPETFIAVGQTPTWCWQMGCRLQWHPYDPNRLILYNTMVKGKYGAVLQDIATQAVERQFNWPVYAMDASGKRALSVNFSRLQRLRPGYGYRNFPDASQGRQCPDDDGIWRIDLSSGKGELLIDLFRLSTLDPLPSMQNAEHYVNHLAFSPAGNRFMFFHLWAVNGKRYNRLITSDWNGENLCVLENKGTASHYTWKSETELLATVHYGQAGTRYNLYTDGSGLKAVVGEGMLTVDGHPSYAPQGTLLLTDTYPDKYREQHVLLLTADGRYIDLARLYSPPAFRGETRCDLHPRWDRTGRLVCVDATADGSRKLTVIKLGDDLSG
jgi:hypothetical protein